MATTLQEVGLGSVEKINIHMEAMDGNTLGNTDWVLSVEGTTGKHEIPKSDAIAEDADNYTAYIDTTRTGLGELKARLSISISDSDAGGTRQIVTPPFSTNIKVV